MTTRRPTRPAKPSSSSRATARLVSGPSASTVSAPGRSRASCTSRTAAAVSGASSAAAAGSRGLSSARMPASSSPTPSAPWPSQAATPAPPTSGAQQPSNTRPRSKSSSAAARAAGIGTLPCTRVTATTSHRCLRSRSAAKSSIPQSVSQTTCIIHALIWPAQSPKCGRDLTLESKKCAGAWFARLVAGRDDLKQDQTVRAAIPARLLVFADKKRQLPQDGP